MVGGRVCFVLCIFVRGEDGVISLGADDGENIQRQAAQTKKKAWERRGGNTGTTTAGKARPRGGDPSYQY